MMPKEHDGQRSCGARPFAHISSHLTSVSTHSRRRIGAARCVATTAAVLWSTLAWAELTPGCPDHDFLGDNPDDSEAPDWSESAQGIANDGAHWFFTRVGGLMKFEANWHAIDAADDVGEIRTVGFPSVLSSQSINHFGDPDYYRGYVFVPFEEAGEPHTVIAAYRASDLEFVDWIDVSSYQPRAGWVAVNPVEGVLYTSTDNLVAGTPLLRYEIDLAKIENGIQGDFLTPLPSVDVLDSNGSAVTGEFSYMQGGVFTPWGDLYLIVGKAGDPVADVRGGIHLFRRTTDGTAFQLIESSVNQHATAGAGVFAYRYDPGLTGYGQEPEGIDWWNRDNDPDSPYPGQLHAILLDNQVEDDNLWLKHYRVDYSCVRADDSDGDGLSDGDEAYVHNTHPLLPDSDGDRQIDVHELACGSDPLDSTSLSADLDADNRPDCVDTDDDGDGQSDADEQACGSNPHDESSQSADFDGDTLLDCLDTDDDNDGAADTGDACPSTPFDLGHVEYAGCDSGVGDFLLSDQAGCSVSQWIDHLAGDSANPGHLVSGVATLLARLQKQGLLQPPQKSAITTCVAR